MTAVRRIVGIPVTLLIALIAQVVLVNRIPLPGGAWPDLVLLTVTALGAFLGPMTGLVAGFLGGLALDVTPPTGHLAGESALVFCLAGYACGRMRDFIDPVEDHATVTSLSVVAVGAAGGEAVKAALGLMLSDPDVTGPAVKHVLPAAILYDLLLSPFALSLIALMAGRSARPVAAAPHAMRPRTVSEYGAVRLAPGGRSGSVGWVSAAGAAPRLRLSGGPSAMGARRSAPRAAPRLRLSGGPSAIGARRSPPGREPRLRFAGGKSPALSRTGGGVSPSPASLGGRRPVSVNFSSSGRGRLIGNAGRSVGTGWSGYGVLGGGLPGGALGPSLFSGSPLRRATGPGKGWLRSSGPGASALRGTPDRRRNSPGKGWLRSSGPGASALRGTPDRRRNSPGKGWLRPARPPKAPRVSSPGKGWLRPARPPKAPRVSSPGKGWLRPAKPPKAARRSSPGKGWLNGSGALGKPTTYQSRPVPFRRRRGIRLGGRR